MTASDKPNTLDHTVTAEIEKDGSYPTFVTLPHSAEVLGTRRPVKVAGTIDGHPFTATLMPSGKGPHWLPLKAALCRAIGKDQGGHTVTIHLQERGS